VGIDQWRLDDEHRETRAVLVHEDRLKAFARRHIASQPDFLALLVLVNQLGRPIRRIGALPHQLVGAETHHLAEGRIDVGDAAFQIAGAQPGHQRVLHGLAKGQRVSQVALGLETTAHVLAQQQQDGDQGDRHGGDQGRQHVGEEIGRATPAVHAQHQGRAGKVQQVLG